MGRAARLKKSKPPARPVTVRLERGDFFELKSLITTARNAELEGVAQLEAVKLQIESAKKAAADRLKALGGAHGFDPMLNYRLDDSTQSLVQE